MPETFGNYVLHEFSEVASPDAISWLPQTTGWAWVGAALLGLSLRYGWKRLRHWHHNRYRREAAARLKTVAMNANEEAWLIELNKILKLTALAAFPRQQVANLSGERWVHFLNGYCTRPPFSKEQCRLLAVGTYSHTTPDANVRQQLLKACLEWVRTHEKSLNV
ncbi:MAG: DUF4381 domain-containing protein [Halioglobus sp.]|nr:DUF4381 domain-containing protein [Halioglobus sp.]